MTRNNLLNFLKSFSYAFSGIRRVLVSERNMKVHVFITLMVLAAGFLFEISNVEWMMCLICFAVVLAAETFNTAIENIVDLVSPEYHVLAKSAKDAAAGAVLICAIVSVIIGLMIFVPKLIVFIQLFQD